MNAPEVKKPRSGFHERVLIRKVRQLRPSPPLTACQVSMLRLAGSRRRSNQMALNSPDGVAAIHGKNWSLGAAAPPALLSTRASVQWKPPSRDSCREMSAPDTARLTLFW